MIVLFVLILAWLGGSALTYAIGRMRTEARWNSRYALAWRRYALRLDAGEEPMTVIFDEFGDLHEKIKTWSVADAKRFLAEERHDRERSK